MEIGSFKMRTVGWRDAKELSVIEDPQKLALRFQSLDSLSPGTFRRLCEERRDLFLDMRKNDMILKLSKGELPFMVDPEDFESAASMAKRHYMDLEEIGDHFRFMQYSGILQYFDSTRIERTFFRWASTPNEDAYRPEPFAAFEGNAREFFNRMSTDEAADFIFDTLMNKRIVEVVRISPGVSVYENS